MSRSILLLLSALVACDATVPITVDPAVGARDATSPDTAEAAAVGPPRVLVFSRTTGFRHTSIPAGIAAVRELATGLGFESEATEDPSWFTPQNLARYRAVVFLSTSGDVLGAEEERAFEGFLRTGGGFVGVHAATDTEYDWPFYQRVIGAAFSKHPAGTPRGRIRRVDETHLSTSHLPPFWERDDEWYSLRESPNVLPEVHVLLELEEDSVPLAPEFRMPGGHPVSWVQAYGGGRAFTTTLGHTEASFAEPAFRQHLAGGIAWAATGANDPRTLVHELDGVSEPGRWLPHGSPFPFDFTVSRTGLSLFDANGVNQHLTREDVRLLVGEPYSIDTLFTVPRSSRNGKTDELNSFCINFDVQGEGGREDDYEHLFARALNLDFVRGQPGSGVTKHMGFVDGGFRAIGEQAVTGVDFDVEYRMTLDVNQDASGASRRDVTTFRLSRGKEILAAFEVDFTSFPYAPDPTKPVRVGANAHGTDWVMRDLRVRRRGR